jgi:6-pyruvoyl-tetrahydropterin synthase
MWDMEFLANILGQFQMIGVEIRIITWLSMDSSEQYKDEVRQAKREWLDEFNFPYDHFHGVAYGTTKADCIRKYLADNEQAILIDDSDKVRKGWHMGETINPTTENICEVLMGILAEILTN